MSVRVCGEGPAKQRLGGDDPKGRSWRGGEMGENESGGGSRSVRG